MRAIPSNMGKLTSVLALLGVLGMWAMYARAQDEDKAPAKPAAAPVKAPQDSNGRFGVEFRNAPWDRVLEWFAKASGLAMITDKIPQGSFTYISPDQNRKYTIPEIVDILNDALQAQKYTLIRHPRSFSVLAADQPIDPAQVPRINVSELDNYGDSELVSAVIPLTSLSAEELAPQLEPMKGPFGVIAAIARPNQLVVQDTGRTIKRIRRLIDDYEKAPDAQGGGFSYVCKYIKARDAASMLKDMLGLPKDTPAAAMPMMPQGGRFDRERRFGGGFQGMEFQPQPNQASTPGKKPTYVYADERLNKVLVSGAADVLAQAKRFLDEADKALSPGQPTITPGVPETKMYTVPSGTAEPIAKMMKEIYKDSKVIRIETGGTNTVLVFAPSDDQLEIGKKILDATSSASSTKRIVLNVLDAGATVDRLREMFGIEPDKPAAMYIGLDADANAVVVRATESQVAEIQDILQKLGETPTATAGNYRILPAGRKDTAAAVKEIERLMKENRNIPVIIRFPEVPKTSAPSNNNGLNKKGGPRFDAMEAQDAPSAKFTGAQPLEQQDKTTPAESNTNPLPQSKPVTISVVGDKIYITSDDPDALEYATSIARTVIGGGGGSGEFEIIRLKRASAVDTAKMLDEFFNGPRQPAGQNPLLQMLGQGGGRGMAMGPAAQVTPAKNKVRVIADPATNALLVRANSSDRRIIHDILKDLESGTDEADALIKPYIIGPFKNTSATEVANVLKDVYSEYMSTAPSATMVGGMRGFGGQFRRQGGGGVDASGNPRGVTLSVAVDDRSNSLIVNCTKPMYMDILNLTDQLDQSASSASKTVRVVSAKNLDPYTTQMAIAAMQGQPMTSMQRPTGMMGNQGMNPFMQGNQFGNQMGRNNPMMNNRGASFGQMGGNTQFNPQMMGGGRGNPGQFGNNPGMMMQGGGRGNMMPGGGGMQMRPGGGGGGMPRGRNNSSPGGGSDFFGHRVKDDPRGFALYDPQLDREFDSLTAATEKPNSIQQASYSVQQASGQVPLQIPPATGSSDNLQAPRSTVSVVPLDELGSFIVTGNNQADVDAVIRIIELLRQLGAGAQLRFELVPLSQADPTNLAQSLTQMFQGVAFTPNSTISRPQTGASPLFIGAQQQQAPQGSVAMYPVPRLSSIFVIAPEARMEDIKEQIRKFDRPISNNAKATQIFLTRASATQVATILTNFYASLPYGQEAKFIQIQPDATTNSILVQAAPADLTQIREIVAKLDSKESGAINDVRIFKLTNQLSDDMAALLQTAITQAVGASAGAAGRPPTPTIPGLQAPTQPGAAGAATKNVTIRFTGPNGQSVQSGWLEDVYIQSSPRINSLIVTAPEKTMDLIAKLIQELDVVPKLKSDIKVINLLKSDANAMANLIQSLFLGTSGTTQQQPTTQLPGGQFPTGGQARTTPTTVQGGSGASTVSGGEGAPIIPVQIVPDPRTNSVIVAGSPGDVEMIFHLVRYLEDVKAPERIIEVYHLKNAQAPDVAQALTSLFGNILTVLSRGNQLQPFQSFEKEVVVISEAVSNRLLISTTPQYYGQVMRVIQQIDQEPPQVVVHALIAQVDLTGNEEFGVEIGLQSPVLFERGIIPQTQFISGSSVGITGGENVTLVPAGVTVNSTNPIAQPGFNFNTVAPLGNNPFAPGRSIVGFQGINSLGVGRNSPNQSFGGFVFSAASDSFNLLVRALKQQGRLQVLSRPMLMTLDRQSSFVLVGQDFPYVTGTTVNLGVSQSSVDYRPVGVQLTVTPWISPDGKVIMRVRPEISSVAPGNIPIGNGAVAVPFNTQTVETTILAEDGETVVVGGLITHRDAKAENKIPWLGDLPGVGALFRYRTQVKSKSELIVILTPRIIYHRSDTEAILAEEAGKMDWMWSDVLRLYNPPALESIAPRKGAESPDGNCEFPEPGPVFSPNGPALGDPVFGEPIHAPMQTAPPPMQQMPPQPLPGPPQPMPDAPPMGSTSRTPGLRGAQRPVMPNATVAAPETMHSRAARPMPNSP